MQLAKSLTSCDILLGLLAAATHDLDHPGVNQPFLIKTDHYLATLYKVNTQKSLLLDKYPLDIMSPLHLRSSPNTKYKTNVLYVILKMGQSNFFSTSGAGQYKEVSYW